MLQHTRKQQEISIASKQAAQDKSLQIVLWLVWTLAVVGVAFLSWHHDMIAHVPLNRVGLIVHCALTGIIGLVVITYIEMRLQPWHFYDE